MSYADIATIMELTPQAVKSLLSRAREKLREVLQPVAVEARWVDPLPLGCLEEIRHALQVPEQGPAQPGDVHVHHHRGLPDPPRWSVLERSQRVNR